MSGISQKNDIWKTVSSFFKFETNFIDLGPEIYLQLLQTFSTMQLKR